MLCHNTRGWAPTGKGTVGRSPSFVCVSIMTTCLQIRSGRVRSHMHGIRSLLLVAAVNVCFYVRGLKNAAWTWRPKHEVRHYDTLNPCWC